MGVERGKILLDDICQLGDLDGSIVKESFPASHCEGSVLISLLESRCLLLTLREPLQLFHRACDTPPNLCCLARKLRSAAFLDPSIGRSSAFLRFGQQRLLGAFGLSVSLLELRNDGSKFGSTILDGVDGHDESAGPPKALNHDQGSYRSMSWSTLFLELDRTLKGATGATPSERGTRFSGA